MSARTVIESVAWPALTSTICMPRPLLASSSVNIRSAQARAISSGESLALTFTRVSLVDSSFEHDLSGAHPSGRSPRARFFGSCSYVIVVHHDLLRNRLGLAGQDEAGLQLPRLQRIVHVHLGLAF